MAQSAESKAYNKTLLEIQKQANNSAKAIQQMINSSNTQQMAFNSAEAQKSRDWQEKMSKTAHQMEVEDLKKAGLNPVLSTGGSGAQSYTTSSASTQNDSGASSTAAIMQGQLGAMANMESARMTSDAQLKSATLQAKAARYAADQSSAAAKYNSNMNYKLGIYRANLDYKSQQEERENKRWITKNQTASSWAGFLDKFLRNSGVSSGASKFIKKQFNWNNYYKQEYELDVTTPSGKHQWLYFKNPISQKLTKDNFKLNKLGFNYTKNSLLKLGYKATNSNVQNFVKATYFHDPVAVKSLVRVSPVKTRQHIRR